MTVKKTDKKILKQMYVIKPFNLDNRTSANKNVLWLHITMDDAV